ncbi:hypothetical protein ACH3XW_18820 [Acanthocheilonema viteae]
MPKGLNDDLEEGEICDDDEEFNINKSNVTEYSDVAINKRMNLTTKCFQSLHHANSESLHSDSLEIPNQLAIFPEINDDNLENKSEDFHNYEMDEEDDKKCFLDQRVIDDDQLDDELKVSNFQDELVEYQSNVDDESDDDDNDNSGFSDEIVCSDGIITANEFHQKMTALTMGTEHITNKSTMVHKDEMQEDLVEEVPVDDSWIFQSLDEPSRIVMQGNEAMDLCMPSESEGNLKEQLAGMDLSKFEVMIDVTVSGCLNCGETEARNVVRDENQMFHEGSNSQTKQITELEKKFAEEKEIYVRNMYSLLVTARAQIATLKKENKKLEMKLQGNCIMNCPKCKHQICLRNNSLKPKYIKVLKGRYAIEMLFDNLEKMEEWLAANYLDINPDGLPVVLELPQKPTLTSTNSLLAPKTRNSDKITLTHLQQERRNRQPAEVANNFNEYSMKRYKKLNHVTRGKETQETSNASIVSSFCAKSEKRSHDRKRSESHKCKEQQCHRVLTTHISPDKLSDHDQRSHFSSSRSSSSHKSRRNTKLNPTKCMMSMSNRKVTDQEDQHIVIDGFRNRFEYRSPSAECRRRPVRSPVRNRRTEESSHQNYQNRSMPDRIKRNLE